MGKHNSTNRLSRLTVLHCVIKTYKEYKFVSSSTHQQLLNYKNLHLLSSICQAQVQFKYGHTRFKHQGRLQGGHLEGLQGLQALDKSEIDLGWVGKLV